MQGQQRTASPWKILLAIGLIGAGGVGAWLWSPESSVRGIVAATPPSGAAPHLEQGELVMPLTLVQSMKLTAAPVRPISAPLSLHLTGQLTLDPNRLVHVTPRFGGEVVSIADGPTAGVPWRVGQAVQQGQLLAVLWSKEMGEKKSDLVDALSQLYLHQGIYERLKALQADGAVAQRAIDEMLRNYEADLIQVERLRRTLTSWRISQEELADIEEEARRIHQKAQLEPGTDAGDATRKTNGNWANIEIRAPISGTILERNLTVGDIVGTDRDLFMIADLSELVVMANVYEDDLPILLGLPAEKRSWRLQLASGSVGAPLPGMIDLIGNVIDPNQHTAIVQGKLSNHDGRLRVGQFVDAEIEFSAQQTGWEIPLAALIDADGRSYVLLATQPDLSRCRAVPVKVHRRTSSIAWVEAADGTELQEGALLLTAGGIELLSVIRQQAASETPPKSRHSQGD